MKIMALTFALIILNAFYLKASESFYSIAGFEPDSLLKNKELLYKSFNDKQDSIEFSNKFSAYDVFVKREKANQKYKDLLSDLDLPKNSRLIEYQNLPDTLKRAFIIWCKNPRVYIQFDDLYTCPEFTLGKGYYYGETFISLIDISKNKIVNTIRIEFALESEETPAQTPLFSTPFSLRNPKIDTINVRPIYEVKGGAEETEGEVKILNLNDFNADGRKYEFAIFQQLDCMTILTSLFGYSAIQDKLINYEVELKTAVPTTDNSLNSYSGEIWKSKIIDEIFLHKCDSKGLIHIEKDYRGRGGALDIYDIKYNPNLEKFEGTINSTIEEEKE